MVQDKSRLVDALSHFPVTALWLIHHYDKCGFGQANEEDDESSLAGETSAVLAMIQRHFSAVETDTKVSHTGDDSEVGLLSESLKQFPYSFHDLSSLVELIVYGCIELNTAFSFSDNKEYMQIIRRRKIMQARAEAQCRQFIEDIRAIWGEQIHQSFLTNRHEQWPLFVLDVVKAETQWLRNRERLTTANSRLVRFIANQYKGGFLDFDDLVQEGQTGLIKAVDRYNYRLGYKFSTYAGYWIRQAISRALSRSERVVRIPCGQMGVINKVYRSKEQLTGRLGKEPSVQDLAEFTGLTRDEIESVFAISQSPVAMEDSSDEESSVMTPIDFLEQQIFAHPFRDIAQSDLESLISKAIKLLSPREARIICGHFGVQHDQEMTLKEIGSELNLTRERVRQIQVMALDKIKRFYGSQLATCLY